MGLSPALHSQKCPSCRVLRKRNSPGAAWRAGPAGGTSCVPAAQRCFPSAPGTDTRPLAAPRWVGKSVPAANELLWGRTSWGGITQGQHAPSCLFLCAHVSGGRGKRGHGPPTAAAQTPRGWAHGNPTCPLPTLPPNTRGSALLRAQGIAATARNLSQARRAPEAAGDSQVTLQCGDREEIPSQKSRTQLSLPTAPHPACPSPSAFDLPGGARSRELFLPLSLCLPSPRMLQDTAPDRHEPEG